MSGEGQERGVSESGLPVLQLLQPVRPRHRVLRRLRLDLVLPLVVLE